MAYDHPGPPTIRGSVLIVFQGVLPRLQHEGRLLVSVDGVPVLLLWDGVAVVAVQGLCPHRGAPLVHGHVTGGVLVCAWHRSVFRCDDGSIVAGPARMPLRVLSASLRGDDVVVGER